MYQAIFDNCEVFFDLAPIPRITLETDVFKDNCMLTENCTMAGEDLQVGYVLLNYWKILKIVGHINMRCLIVTLQDDIGDTWELYCYPEERFIVIGM